MTAEDDIRSIFADNRTNEARIRALVEYVDGYAETWSAWPKKARVQVEQVEAYGLVLGVDANGDACRVDFPRGADI